jgi:hypothetical protein
MWFRVATAKQAARKCWRSWAITSLVTAVETQNEGRQENLSFAADSMAHK